jgi:hypothetical protein
MPHQESSELHRVPSSRCQTEAFASLVWALPHSRAFGHCKRRWQIPHNDAFGVARDERGSEPIGQLLANHHMPNACHTRNQASFAGCHRPGVKVKCLHHLFRRCLTARLSAIAREAYEFRTTTPLESHETSVVLSPLDSSTQIITSRMHATPKLKRAPQDAIVQV